MYRSKAGTVEMLHGNCLIRKVGEDRIDALNMTNNNDEICPQNSEELVDANIGFKSLVVIRRHRSHISVRALEIFGLGATRYLI